jgi:hypothetical protein
MPIQGEGAEMSVTVFAFGSTKGKRRSQKERALLESRPAYHLRCVREDATDPATTTLERLTLVRDRVRWIREIRRELVAAKVGGLETDRD